MTLKTFVYPSNKRFVELIQKHRKVLVFILETEKLIFSFSATPLNIFDVSMNLIVSCLMYSIVGSILGESIILVVVSCQRPIIIFITLKT